MKTEGHPENELLRLREENAALRLELADCESTSDEHAAIMHESDRVRKENVALALRLERDSRTYATMQKGMESQAELGDGLKQRCRELEAEVARLRDVLAPFAALADRYIPNVSDSSLLSEWWPNDDPRQSATVGDCRKAQEALR